MRSHSQMQRVAVQPSSSNAQNHRFGVTGKALNASTALNFLSFVPISSQIRPPKAALQVAQQSMSQGASPMLSPQSPLGRRDSLRPSHFEAERAEREREEQELVQKAQCGKALNQLLASQGSASAALTALLGRDGATQDNFVRSPAQTRATVISPLAPSHHST
jgi:hypothetical protein